MSIQNKNRRIVIVGAGPAGLMAAIFAAKHKGIDIRIFEKNEKAGKKLYITGKGRCNLCNACEKEELMKNIVRNSKFMYAALHLLSPDALRDMLKQLGCPSKVERGNRVFPVSEKSSDVIKALLNGLSDASLFLRNEVKAILAENGKVNAVILADGEMLPADCVIIATGGLSYPVTGSTGDGYRFAQKLGHNIVATSPSLVPIETEESWIPALAGLSLKNVTLSILKNGKVIWSDFGEMLFTHRGISGPIALSASAQLSGLDLQEYHLSLDMKPALTKEQLNTRLINEFKAHNKKHLSNVFPSLLPHAFAELFPDILKIDGSISCSCITSEMRSKIVNGLKAINITAKCLGSYREAVVTRGGVDVKEINPKTLASKLVTGLYFAGEVLDIDAYTGGFNLQIAFSTGALAGKSAAEYLKIAF